MTCRSILINEIGKDKGHILLLVGDWKNYTKFLTLFLFKNRNNR